MTAMILMTKKYSCSFSNNYLLAIDFLIDKDTSDTKGFVL